VLGGDLPAAGRAVDRLPAGATRVMARTALAMAADDIAAYRSGRQRLRRAPAASREIDLMRHLVAGEMERLQEQLGRDDVIDELGLLWHLGQYTALKKLAEAERQERGEPELERRRRTILTAQRRFNTQLEARGNRVPRSAPEAADAFVHVRNGLIDDEQSAVARALVGLDPADPAWRLLVGDEVAAIMPLHDWAMRLERAAAVLQLADDEAVRSLARQQLVLGARLAMANAPADAAFRAQALAMARADQAGDRAAAKRFATAAALALLRSDVRRGVDAAAGSRMPDWRALPQATFIWSHLEHYRMLDAQAAGDEVLAREAFERAMSIRPIDAGTMIDRVVHLDATGRTAEANATFAEAFERLLRPTAEFEQSAFLANQAAWVAARCQRRPDTALALASRAVALRPDNLAYQDTLAEAYLAAGQREKALELFERLPLLSGHGEFAGAVLRLREARSAATSPQ
jgi:tetratricopeptide (TPR) repeat protein